MAISSTTNRVTYLGDGSSAIFSFAYEFHAEADLDVFIWNSARIVATAAQVLNTHYTISGVQDAQDRFTNGANVVFNSSPATGDHIVITRDVGPTQPFNLKFNQVIPNQELVKGLDRLALVEQRLKDLTDRSVRLHDSFPNTFEPRMPDRLPAGAALIIGSSGQTIETGVVSITGTSVTTFFGILPVPAGGTGLDLSLLDGIIYSPGNNTTMERIVDGGQDVPLLGTAGSSKPAFGPLPLTSGSSTIGILPQSKGGTGTASSFVQYGLIYQQDASVYGQIPSQQEGYVLTAHGSSKPDYQPISAVLIQSGIVIVSHGGTGTGTSYIENGVVFASSATQFANTAPGGIDVPFMGNGSAAPPSFRGIPLTSNSSVIGILQQLHGGTGTASSFPQFSIIHQDSALALGHIPPAAAGTVLTQNASSAPSFQAVTPTPVAPTSIDAVTTLTSAQRFILLNSSNYNVQLYDAVGNSGRQITLKRQDSTFSNPITILCSGTQTIGGSGISFPMYTRGESLDLISDGSDWVINNHFTNPEWINSGPLTLSAVTTAPQKGNATIVTDQLLWRRIGDSVEFRAEYRHTSAGSSVGSGDYLLVLPTGLVMDASKLTFYSTSEGSGAYNTNNVLGASIFGGSGTECIGGGIVAYDSTSVRFFGTGPNNTGVWGSAFQQLTLANVFAVASFTVPIDGWRP